jgi:hypothetical protein
MKFAWPGVSSICIELDEADIFPIYSRSILLLVLLCTVAAQGRETDWGPR